VKSRIRGNKGGKEEANENKKSVVI